MSSIGNYKVVSADEPPIEPTVQELEQAFRLLWVAHVGTARDAAAIAAHYGPAAIPALQKLSGEKKLFEGDKMQLPALTALALLSEDKQAFEILRRRSENNEATWLPVLMFMPPTPRDALLWQAFQRDVGMARPAFGAVHIVELILALAETGTQERLESLAEAGRSMPNASLLQRLIELLVADRARVSRMTGLTESKIIALNAATVSQWRAARGDRFPGRPLGGSFTRAQLTPPLEYLVARAAYSRQPQEAPSDDAEGWPRRDADLYLGLCAEVTRGMALHDIPGMGQIALGRFRDQDLRRAAVALLVKTPERADGDEHPGRSTSPLKTYSANSIAELNYLSKNGQPDLLTWIAEEIIARPKSRPEFKALLADLSTDERLTPELREKCKLYAQRAE